MTASIAAAIELAGSEGDLGFDLAMRNLGSSTEPRGRGYSWTIFESPRPQ